MTAPREGRSRERTGLAWDRSALGAAVLGILLIRFGIENDDATEYAAAGAALLMSLLIELVAWQRARNQRPARPPELRAITALAVLTCVLTTAGIIVR